MTNFAVLLVLPCTSALFIEKKYFSVIETKREAALFCSEVNTKGYSEMEKQADCTRNNIYLHGMRQYVIDRDYW